MAIAHILPPNARVTSGKVYFKGKVVVSPEMGASYSIRYDRKERKIENQLSIVRWKGISVIFQGALDSLNPVHKVGTQSESTDNSGCLFAPRCQFAKDICSAEKPELLQVSQSHSSRCHFAQDIQGMGLTEIKAKKEAS